MHGTTRNFTQHQIRWHINLRWLGLQNCEQQTSIVFKLPSLRYFVTVRPGRGMLALLRRNKARCTEEKELQARRSSGVCSPERQFGSLKGTLDFHLQVTSAENSCHYPKNPYIFLSVRI